MGQRLAVTAHGVVSSPIIVIDGNYWNPLEDDGDCAQLETKCEMLVSVDKDCARAGSYINGYGIECSEQYANHDGDRNKARRFASVRLRRRTRAQGEGATMTTLEELNQREAEELLLVREKYAKLRMMVQARCEHERDLFLMPEFGYVEVDQCKHRGAALEEV